METAPGQNRAWNLLEKLGEGDAGEIYRVESLLDRTVAILKRPRRKAFPSDIIRQAAQIEKEAQILAALANHDSSGELARVPILKDKSKPGTEYSDRYFIVLSPASGMSLAELSRLAHFQSMPAEYRVSFYRSYPTRIRLHRKNRTARQTAGYVTPARPDQRDRLSGNDPHFEGRNTYRYDLRRIMERY